MADSTATFFISTGRCATQWFAAELESTYSDIAEVVHEPLQQIHYQPRHYFRIGDRNREMLGIETIAKHFSHVKEVLQNKHYIETGWPAYSAIPLLAEEFKGRIKLVQLIRHPVTTALSMATHNVYDRGDWTEAVALTPFDEGAQQPELAAAWPEMTLYEKCLFWWTEIHSYGKELQQQFPDVPFHVCRYEEIFRKETGAFAELCRFLELPVRERPERGEKRTDRFSSKTAPVDWKLIRKYPRTVELSESFGYSLDDISTADIKERYFPKFYRIRRMLGLLKS